MINLYRKAILFTLGLSLFVFGQGILQAQTLPLYWSDEFNGAILDTTKWNYEVNDWGGGNGELQYYTARTENISLNGGYLYVTGRKENYGHSKYTSGRIHSATHGSFTYGEVYVRAKLPKGNGFWPAIWLLPTDENYGGWPCSGEIDMMEALGQDSSKYYTTIHYGKPNHGSIGQGDTAFTHDLTNDFHVYGLKWTPGMLRFLLDSVEVFNVPFARPFDQRFHVLLNLAIGGAWPVPPDSTTIFPSSMVVDYVRIYATQDSLVYQAAQNPTGLLPGLEYRYYSWPFNVFVNGISADYLSKGTISNFNLIPTHQRNNWGLYHLGYLNVPTTGTYTFYVNSADGTKLYLADKLIVTNDGQHIATEHQNQVKLEAGYHPIRLGYLNAYNTASLSVSWSGPGFAKQPIPDANLFHTVPADTLPVSLNITPTVPVVTTVGGQSATICKGSQVQLNATAKAFNGGNALFFKSDSLGRNYVKLPNNLHDKFTNGFTFEAWIKPEKTDYYNRIFRFGNSGWQDHIDFEIDYGSQNRIGFEIVIGGKDYGCGLGITEVPVQGMDMVNLVVPNRWMHVAFTMDRTNVTLYLNGILALQQPCDKLPGDIAATFNNFLGRGSMSDHAKPFQGYMDEVRLWNQARSQTDIVASMSKSVPIASTNLVAYYPMEQSTGGWLTDVTGHGYDGKMYYFYAPIFTQSTVYGFQNDFVNVSWSPSTGLSSTTGATVSANPSTTTTYTATVSDFAGNSNSSTFTVTVLPTIAPTVSPNNVNTCGEATATLTASGTGPFIWNNGATGSSITVSQSGPYWVTSGNCLSLPVSVTLNTSYATVPLVKSNNSLLVCPGNNVQLTAWNPDTGSQNCLNFNDYHGVTPNYVALPNNLNLKMSYGFTFEGWFNLATNTQWTRLFALGSSLVNRMEFVTNPAGVGRFRIEFTGYDNITLPASPQLDPALNADNSFKTNQWFHFAVVMDGFNLNIYMNGNLIYTQEFLVVPYSVGNTNLNYLGKSEFPNDAAFAGKMEEVRIWGIGRTQQEIRNYMYNRFPAASSKYLIAYYQMDQTGTNTLVPDSSGNGNNGTFVNGTGTFWSPSALPNFNTYTYAWSPTSGLSTTTGNTTVVTPSQTTEYTVKASNVFGCVNTGKVTVVSVTPPQITAQASASSVCEGQKTGFKIKATSNGTLTYQWQVSSDLGTSWQNLSDGSRYAGSLTDTLGLNSTDTTLSGNLYRCMVSGCSPAAYSSSVKLVVSRSGAAAISLTATSGTSICLGDTARFKATLAFAGTSPIITWRVNNQIVSGQTGTSFVYPSPTNGDIISADLVSNASCATSTQASSTALVLTVVNNASLVPTVSVSTSTSPVCPSIPVVFTANPVNGGSLPSYVWKVNGAVVGLNNNSFTTLGLNGNDTVTCTVTSSLNCTSVRTAVSNKVIVSPSVSGATVSIQASASGSVCRTGNLFTAIGTNAGTNPTYIWKKNGLSTSTTTATYSDNNLNPGDTLKVTLIPGTTCGLPVTSNNYIVPDISASPTPVLTASDSVVCLGNSLTLAGSSPDDGPGNMLQFNSSTQGQNYLSLPANLHGIFTQGITFEAWIKPSLAGNYTRIFRLGSTNLNRIEFILNTGNTGNGGRMGFEASGTGFNNSTLAATPAISGLGTNNVVVLNQWIHVAFTMNGTSRILYINGIRADSVACSVLPPVLAATNENKIGGAWSGDAGSPAFSGAMDEIRIWTQARTRAQILGNMYSRVSPNAKGLAVYYQLDETSGTSPYDASKNGRTGTLVNFSGTVWAGSTVSNFNPVTYSWSPSQGLSTTSGKNTVLTPTISAPYTLTVSNAQGCTGTKTVNVVVNQALAILRNPASAQVCAGSNAVFTVKANGLRMAYQWQQSTNSGNLWTNISGATDTIVTIVSVTAAQNNYSYRCQVSGCGLVVYSSPGTLTVPSSGLPSISLSSSSGLFLCPGSTISLSTSINLGGSNPVYRWYVNGQLVPGVNTSTWATNVLQNGDQVFVQLVSSAACATAPTANSNVLTFSTGSGNNLIPAISISASANPVCPNTGVVFTANAVNGGVSPVYTWKVNGITVGSNSPTYSTTGLNPLDTVTCTLQSSFSCAALSTVQSGKIQVNVAPTPSTVSISSGTGCVNGTVFTAITTNAGANPTFVWRKNGQIVGNSTATYTGSGMSPGDSIKVTLSPDVVCGLAVTSAAFYAGNLNQSPNPVLSMVADSVICQGNSVSITASSPNEGAGNMLNFNSPTSGQNYVSLPNNINSTMRTGFTFEAWIKATTNPSWNRVFTLGSGVSNRLEIQLNNGGTQRIGIEMTGATTLVLPSTPAISGLGTNNIVPLGTWFHFAMVLNGSTMKIYINGNLAASQTCTVLPSALNTTTTNFLGKSQYSGDAAFNGSLDEVKIWNVARSASDLLTNYNTIVAPNSTGLLAYYQMNQSSGTSLSDATSNANNGTLTNFNGTVWATSTNTNFNNYTYTWSPATGLNTTSGKSVTANPSVTTNYSLSVAAPNTCAVIKTKLITVNTQPRISGPRNGCGSITLTSSGSGPWVWSTGATTASITVSTSGKYKVTTRGCLSDSVTVNVNRLVTVTAQPASTTICSGTGTSFTYSATGDSISWYWQESTNAGSTWRTLSDGGIYVGTKTATLSLSAVSASYNNYQYRAVLSSPCQSALTSNTSTLKVLVTGTWIGLSNDWTNNANWCGGKPDTINDIIIPASANIQPVVGAGGLGRVRSITIDSGASLTLSGTGQLTVLGNLTINGTLTLGSNSGLVLGGNGFGITGNTDSLYIPALTLRGNYTQNIRAIGIGTNNLGLGNLTLAASKRLTLYGSNTWFTVDGSATGSYVTIAGTGSSNFKGGNFSNFRLNRNNGLTNVSGAMTVNSTLSVLNGNLNVQGNDLTLKGNLILTDSLTATTGKLILKSGSALHNLTASGYADNLSLQDSLGATLTGKLVIGKSLSFVKGMLKSGSADTVILQTSANLTGETAKSNYMGTILQSRFIGTDSSSFGGLGFWIDKGTDNLGNVTFIRKTYSGALINPLGNSGSIQCIWEIDIDGNQPSNGRNVSFKWVNTCDVGRDMSAAYIYRKQSANSGWERLNNLAMDARVSGNSDNRYLKFTTTHFSTYTISDAANPLPLTLLGFRAQWQNVNAQLDWETAQTQNFARFEVEKTMLNHSNIFNFAKIGSVEGLSNSSTVQAYRFTDFKAREQATDTQYYRLKMVDLDGSFTYSNVVSLGKQSVSEPVIFPNPFTNKLEGILPQGTGTITISLTDVIGRKVVCNSVIRNGNHIAVNGLDGFAPGLYMLEIEGVDGVVFKGKMVKE